MSLLAFGWLAHLVLTTDAARGGYLIATGCSLQ
jgi:hypothetical protein